MITEYRILNENTLIWREPNWYRNGYKVLKALKDKGLKYRFNKPLILGSSTNLRPATKEDFSIFGLEVPPNFS